MTILNMISIRRKAIIVLKQPSKTGKKNLFKFFIQYLNLNISFKSDYQNLEARLKINTTNIKIKAAKHQG